MCLSKAFLEHDGEREVILEQVAAVSVSDGTLSLRNLFGEQKEIGGRIREIDFLTHSIVVEEVRSSGSDAVRSYGPDASRSAGPETE
jgi:predicted RNA-binding protein